MQEMLREHGGDDPKRPFESLRFKIAAGVTVILVALAGLLFILLFIHLRNQLLQEYRRSIFHLNSVVEASLQHAMLTTDWEQAQNIVEAIRRQDMILNIMILDKKGEIKLSGQRGQIGQVLSQQDPTCQACHRCAPDSRPEAAIVQLAGAGRVFRSAKVMVNEPECQGCHGSEDRVLGVDVTDMVMVGYEERLAAAARGMVLGSVGVIAVMIATTALFVDRTVTLPLRRFEKVTERIRNGDLNHSVVVHSGDEIGRLAASFNEMMADLREREEQLAAKTAALASEVAQRKRAEEELRKVNEELELHVAERTAELVQANEQLHREISRRKQVERQLVHDAFHDALTGLPNRALFTDRLGRAVERAKRHKGYLFAVLFLDLDRFKVINDSLGHTLGDELLIAMARRLRICLRAVDTVARLGGDEFVILLEDLRGASDATHLAERIQGELKLPFNLSGHRVFTSASIGIVLGGTGYERPEDVLRDADIAMYRAKALGKARYEVFNTAMHARAKARLELETALQQAMERQAFQLHYQPIVTLGTGRIVGFEALLRWQHPVRGYIPPMEFIPVAEESGLIIPIGQWVLREGCRQMREWQAQFPADPPWTISVNLSARQFAQPGLVEQVEQILQETGLDACSLKLELTESVIMEDAESAVATLLELRALGVHVQIDDFGTGYSALGYLQRFPLNTIKIDRSFVSMMDGDGNDSEIVETVLELAHSLGMDVIAEGVETAEQVVQLQMLQCEHAQGYFFSRPLDGAAAGRLLQRHYERMDSTDWSMI